MTTIIECFKTLQWIDWVLIVAILLILGVYIYLLVKITRLPYVGGFIGKWNIRVCGSLIGLLVVFYMFCNLPEILPHEWVEISMLAGLVAATGALAVYAAAQAYTSVEMVREMREQRIMTSQPRLIQKSIHEKDIWEGSTKDYFSHFEISNVGNIPAIEVESSLIDSEGNRSHSIRQTFLTNNDPPIKFRPSNITNLEETKTYYIVCEYQNIFSHGLKNPLYQTRLPFKISKSGQEGKIYMVAGELEFKEASEEERIDAFSRRSKPK